MTPLILIDELIKFIEPVVKDFELQTNIPDIRKAPQVISGYLGEKKASHLKKVPDFPYVIVRFLEDDDKDQGHTATVRIIAGTYSEDVQNGWRDCVNVMTRIKQALLQRPFIGPFKVEKPIRMELPEEQPYPEWAVLMTFQVSLPQIQEEGGYMKDVFE